MATGLMDKLLGQSGKSSQSTGMFNRPPSQREGGISAKSRLIAHKIFGEVKTVTSQSEMLQDLDKNGKDIQELCNKRRNEVSENNEKINNEYQKLYREKIDEFKESVRKEELDFNVNVSKLKATLDSYVKETETSAKEFIERESNRYAEEFKKRSEYLSYILSTIEVVKKDFNIKPREISKCEINLDDIELEKIRELVIINTQMLKELEDFSEVKPSQDEIQTKKSKAIDEIKQSIEGLELEKNKLFVGTLIGIEVAASPLTNMFKMAKMGRKLAETHEFFIKKRGLEEEILRVEKAVQLLKLNHFSKYSPPDIKTKIMGEAQELVNKEKAYTKEKLDELEDRHERFIRDIPKQEKEILDNLSYKKSEVEAQIHTNTEEYSKIGRAHV